MTKRIIVIGCGTAGAAATLQARKTNREASIILLQDEASPEYSRCGLPYAVSKAIPEIEDLIIHPPDFYEGRLVGADLQLNTRATKIDVKAKTVQVDKPDGTKETLSYDALVIATGSRPSAPPIEGLDASHVYRMHTLDDARAVQAVAKRDMNVAIIGAGLVGMETAESLHSLGLHVTVIEFFDSVLPAMIDADIAGEVVEKMEAAGISVKLGTAAKAVLPGKVLVEQRASSETEEVPADIVVVATGVRSNTELAKDAGITVNRGIVIDETMATSAPDVYAAGDCAEHLDLVTGQPIVSGLGSIALRQGEVAGINAAGGKATLPGVIMARTTHLFGLEIAAVGPTRSTAERAEIPILAGKFKGSVTAEYYPSEGEVAVKILANKETGALLGGQVIGPCAHQRANVLGAALMAKMSVRQVADLETCYAPPVAPIREPVALAAHILALRYSKLKARRSKSR
jgi:NADH oxidase (H2O2-forming)